MEDDTLNDTYNTIKIGNEKYLVNRTEKTLQKLESFECLVPHYDSNTGLCLKLISDNKEKIEKLPPHMLETVIIPKSKSFSGKSDETFTLKSSASNSTSSKDLEKKFSIKKEYVEALNKMIYAYGFEKPNTIQTVGILPLINGSDCMIQSKSGTGKTHTFLIGLLWNFDPSNDSLQYLILTSTHEIATQIYQHVQKLVKSGVRTVLCIGAGNKSGGFKATKSIQSERQELQQAQIIVGTVGKTYDYLCVKAMIKNPTDLRAICMDEFDHLVSPQRNSNNHNAYGTKPEDQINSIMQKIPPNAQRAFFSATVTEDSIFTIKSYFRSSTYSVGNPFMLFLEEDNYLLAGIKHYYVELDSFESKKEALLQLLSRLRIPQLIIFVNKTETAGALVDYLTREQRIAIPCAAFHGQLSKNERDTIYSDFKVGKYRFLISTDVLSRGIDIHTISAVMNFDMPNTSETYIHRIGRCGRHGRKGIAINFILISENKHARINEMEKVLFINDHSNNNKMIPLPNNIEDLL